jgi:hypothetical protein
VNSESAHQSLSSRGRGISRSHQLATTARSPTAARATASTQVRCGARTGHRIVDRHRPRTRVVHTPTRPDSAIGGRTRSARLLSGARFADDRTATAVGLSEYRTRRGDFPCATSGPHLRPTPSWRPSPSGWRPDERSICRQGRFSPRRSRPWRRPIVRWDRSLRGSSPASALARCLRPPRRARGGISGDAVNCSGDAR